MGLGWFLVYWKWRALKTGDEKYNRAVRSWPKPGEKVDVEGAIESGGRRRKSIEHTAIGAGAGALLGGIFGGGKGAGIGSIIRDGGGLGTTAFHGHQKITLRSGQEMLIRITSHQSEASGATS
jgi:hypothetical protein